ncbi:MAG: GGDEF domain-containing protein [Actinomycetota bacterium]|nr:GGDEF domain-containing protein [Actinomycetota bacterium]
MLDLDNFKLINDTCGHASGDEALRTVARVLQEILRGTDISARFGGDEFAVILPETDAAGAELVAEKLATNVRQRTANVESEVNPTVSIGIALFGAQAHRSKEDVSWRPMERCMRPNGPGETVAPYGPHPSLLDKNKSPCQRTAAPSPRINRIESHLVEIHHV